MRGAKVSHQPLGRLIYKTTGGLENASMAKSYVARMVAYHFIAAPCDGWRFWPDTIFEWVCERVFEEFNGGAVVELP
jgi:hypothetical protein